MSRIVVGVDGSHGSELALRWAAEEAKLREVPVEAVYVYEDTPSYELYEYPTGLQHEPDEVRRQRAAEHAREMVEGMVKELANATGVHIDAVVVEHRRPAHALVERSEDADMLVVGSRGRGGFTGLVLGSVSQQLTHHARCPLVVVPSAEQAETA